MTKEPIMIDDVDVAECEYAEPSYTTPKCAINDWIHCDGHDCHYKQLKRKEKECEEWKHQAELGSDTTDILTKQLEEKEQELDECREKFHKQLNQLKVELKAEKNKLFLPTCYEKLYKEIKKMNNDITKKCFELEKENKELKEKDKEKTEFYKKNLIAIRSRLYSIKDDAITHLLIKTSCEGLIDGINEVLNEV